MRDFEDRCMKTIHLAGNWQGPSSTRFSQAAIDHIELQFKHTIAYINSFDTNSINKKDLEALYCVIVKRLYYTLSHSFAIILLLLQHYSCLP